MRAECAWGLTTAVPLWLNHLKRVKKLKKWAKKSKNFLLEEGVVGSSLGEPGEHDSVEGSQEVVGGVCSVLSWPDDPEFADSSENV